MAPSESDVLTNHLIRPSTLSAAVTYEYFTSLLPPSQRDSPQARLFWRDLEAQRGKVLDQVRANIEDEVKRGNVMRKEMLRQRREAMKEEDDAEIETERVLFGDKSGAKSAKHTLMSVIPELDGAAGALQAEIDKLESEEAELLNAIRGTVGALSDLRYGKLANAQLKDEVLDGLTTLQETCEQKMG